MSAAHSFKEMPIWQHSLQFVVQIYHLTAQLPATERLGLSSSLQRAAIILPTLLGRGSQSGRRGFRESCIAARGSAAELETLLLISQQLYPAVTVDDLLLEISDMQVVFGNMAQRLATLPTPKTI